MNACPACGYAPEGVAVAAPAEELWKKRLRDLFGVHLMNSWWLSQPKWIMEELLRRGISITSLLDAGCGDGRWLPGIKEVYPNCRYVGIDRMQEHVEINLERQPEGAWVHADFLTWDGRQGEFDFILFGGVFNPAMEAAKQADILARAVALEPRWIGCLFDSMSTGTHPGAALATMFKRRYVETLVLKIPVEEQGPRQDCIFTLHERQK